MKKIMLEAQVQKEYDAKVLELAAAIQDGSKSSFLSAQMVTELMNEPYDAELPVNDVGADTAEYKSVMPGMTVEYFVQDVNAKTVYTISAGVVTQVPVTPKTPTTLALDVYAAPEDYLTINSMLTQKYDSLAEKAADQYEALNRLEQKALIDLYFAAAEDEKNVFTNVSGSSVITFPVLVDMGASLAKYGKNNLVLIAGSDVSRDIKLMDYFEDKNRELVPAKAGINKVISVENYQFTHSGTQTVMPTDRALLVATSDSQKNRPAIFARRRIPVNTDAKERAIFAKDLDVHMVGAVPTLAYKIITVGSFGAAVTNPKCFAAYQKADTYVNLIS